MPFSETPRGEHENWGSISIDEMNPVFDSEANTVTLTSEHFSQSMKEGDTLTVASNEKPASKDGKVISIDKENKTITVELQVYKS